jgi:hypothetical protein
MRASHTGATIRQPKRRTNGAYLCQLLGNARALVRNAAHDLVRGAEPTLPGVHRQPPCLGTYTPTRSAFGGVGVGAPQSLAQYLQADPRRCAFRVHVMAHEVDTLAHERVHAWSRDLGRGFGPVVVGVPPPEAAGPMGTPAFTSDSCTQLQGCTAAESTNAGTMGGCSLVHYDVQNVWLGSSCRW